jgi:serine/threonine protein kinase
MSDTSILDSKITEFYERLVQNVNQINQSSEVPELIRPFIQKNDLLSIYEKLLTDKKINKHMRPYLSNQAPVRMDKLDWQLARTINIVFDPQTDDICLMLETKHKTASTNHKNPNTPIHSGRYKTVKPCWRIDTMLPIKYANAVFYADEEISFSEDAIREADYSKKLAQKHLGAHIPLQKIAPGALFKKTGTRKLVSKHAFVQKISLYSSWAEESTLEDFLKTDRGKNLSLDQKNSLAYQLLYALKILHDEHFIHQDIKPENILIFMDDQGNYTLELIDFGTLYDPKTPKENYLPLATIQYESPEISALYFYHRKDLNLSLKRNYAYYHEDNLKFYSYGKKLFKSNHTAYPHHDKDKDIIVEENIDTTMIFLPHEKNDMWAAGIVLYQLFNDGNIPGYSSVPNFSPLIAGLLTVDRENRLTADEAFLHQQAIVEKDKKEVSEKKEEKKLKEDHEDLKSLCGDPLSSSTTTFTLQFRRLDITSDSPLNSSPIPKEKTWKPLFCSIF